MVEGRRSHVEITNTNANITTPAGTFNCIEIKWEPSGANNGDYYLLYYDKDFKTGFIAAGKYINYNGSYKRFGGTFLRSKNF
jgi:hypothetical protein